LEIIVNQIGKAAFLDRLLGMRLNRSASGLMSAHWVMFAVSSVVFVLSQRTLFSWYISRSPLRALVHRRSWSSRLSTSQFLVFIQNEVVNI